MDDLAYHDALALLDWHLELGADEAILDAPIDRFAIEAEAKAAAQEQKKPTARPASSLGTTNGSEPTTEATVDATEQARSAAASATDLPALRAAMEAFEHCELRESATQLVFSDGAPEARIMIVGEAPGRDEDRMGKPFVGRAGHLLDRMFEAIGLDRAAETAEKGLYITNMLPWRPPQNRDPTPEELSMLGPFVRRHIELVEPEILILMGNAACQGLLGKRGITRLRGTWTEVMGRPTLPMFHPAYLLRKPHEKSKAWADLLSIQAKRLEL